MEVERELTEQQMQQMLNEAFPGPPPVPDPVPITGQGSDYFYVPDDVEPAGDSASGLSTGPSLFESDEHDAIGQAINLYTIDGSVISASGAPLFTVSANVSWAAAAKWHDNPLWAKKIELQFGRTIALAGDYYSNVDKNYTPICGAFYESDQSAEGIKSRFKSMVDALKSDFNGYLNPITHLLDDEHAAIDYVRNPELKDLAMANQFAQAYHDEFHGMPGTKDFVEWTVKSKNALSGLYPWLAYINADHFGNDAVTVYKAGHQLALEQAKAAKDIPKGKSQSEALSEAYLIEAMACHYLTDLFSAGHNRAPRRQFHSTDWVYMAWAGLKDKPVWDIMCRWCHDDDSASGLAFTNGLGERWIGYGDKQLFEDRNQINLLRAIQAVQASVDEVFKEGFQNGRTQLQDFAAIKLLPLPILAVKGTSQNPSGWSRHNPAPLWVAESDAVMAPSWTYRANINDHSNFARKLNGVGSEDPITLGIKDAPFRGNDQFLKNFPLDAASGGFIQIMQTADTATRSQWQTANVWGPITTTVPGRTTRVISLRGQTQDFYASNDLGQAVPMHCVKWFDGKLSRFIRFDCVYESGAVNAQTHVIRASSYVLINNQPDASKQGVDFETARRAPITVKATGSVDVLKHNGVTSMGWVNNLRLVLKRSNQSDPSNDFTIISILSLTTQGSPSSGSLNIKSTTLTFVSDTLTVRSTSDKVYDGGSAVIGFAKQLANSTHGTSLLLANIKSNIEPGKSRLFLYDIHPPSGGDWTIDAFEDSFNDNDGTHWSILTGDVVNAPDKADQIVAVGDKFPNYNVRLYGRGADQALQLLSTHSCAASSPMSLVCNYLTALVPSTSSNTGLDTINISLHKNPEGRYKLLFHTHRRTNNGAGGDPYGDCIDSIVDDPLASHYSSGAYFSIKWVRCSRAGYKNAIMEIFSWYGVLGARLFAPDPKAPKATAHGKYKMIGIHYYMGQNSLGLGLGCEGDWGFGFMTWGPNEDWIDSNAWKLKADGKNGEGAWGMSPDDLQRPLIAGWDVEHRPRPQLL